MDNSIAAQTDPTLYERDFYAWCQEQAARLKDRTRPGANDGLDYLNLAEEIECLGRSEKNALLSHMIILLLHLLKWRHQPGRRGSSWEDSIANARGRIGYLIEDSPSLRRLVGQEISRAYPTARRRAAAQTKLPRSVFPEACPFTEQQTLDHEFFPSDLDAPANK
jgi:hypothetical protein